MFGFWSRISWAKSLRTKKSQRDVWIFEVKFLEQNLKTQGFREMGIENEIRVLWGNGPLTRNGSSCGSMVLDSPYYTRSVFDWAKNIYQRGYLFLVEKNHIHWWLPSTLIMVGPLFLWIWSEKLKQKEEKLDCKLAYCTDFKVPGVEGWCFDIDFQWKQWPILVGLATIMINQWST